MQNTYAKFSFSALTETPACPVWALLPSENENGNHQSQVQIMYNTFINIKSLRCMCRTSG